MTTLNLRQPTDLATALAVSVEAWARRSGGNEAEIAEIVGTAGEIARAIAEDLAERVKPGTIVDGVLPDLPPWMLAMEICDLLLVEAYGESHYYTIRASDDWLRMMADQIAAETIAAWPPVTDG